MTNQQWEKLLAVLNGERVDPLAVGFIIDSPWLPQWAGMSILDYYASERKWLDANLEAVRRFPDVMFLPGFWSEYGMCTEPSAFGCRCLWQENDLPFAEPVLKSCDDIASLDKPDPGTAGLLPLTLKRLVHCRDAIESAGHAIRFAVARGPLNIAAFLMGSTEFLMAMKTDADKIHALLETISDFLVDWIQLQAETIPTIDGVFLLDDIVGFVGEADFVELAKPYLKRVFEAVDASVRFFHNDAAGLVCGPHLPEIGVNLFNFAFEHSLAQMRELTRGEVTLLGNIPPRDVLAAGTGDDVRASVRAATDAVADTKRIILSCGGGMPPGVPTENIEAFIEAARPAL